jgi:AraC-like DNA-binding protein
MSLLFLQLSGNTQTLHTDNEEEDAVFKVLQYVDTHYANGSFADLVELMHYNPSWLSRQIKTNTGKTYTQLVQEKRLSQAAFLLRNTDMNVDHVANTVGYENLSHFHRLFAATYGKTPKQYRDS